jgi:AcrR family transcriptional regulator
VDARIEATRRQLKGAILVIAAQRDVNTITVAELARAAGIDRSTFYSHASSPLELLERVLSEDLDPLRVEIEQVLEQAPWSLAEVGARLTARLIDHVERYDAVYADRAGGSPSSALHTVLSGHMRVSLEVLFAHLGAMDDSSPLASAYMAAFIAHGIVGAVSVWLATPAPRDRAHLESVLDLVYSLWLLPASDQHQKEVNPR